MRLSVVQTKNAASLYVIESTYIGGKHSTRVVEKLGTEAALRKRLNGEDPYEWAQTYICELNRQAREGTRVVTAQFNPRKQIPADSTVVFNGGYWFPKTIYYGLRLNEICKTITDKHRFRYDLNAILSRLIYTRILYPSSKLSSYEASKRFVEPVSFGLEDVYRALDVIAQESESIQAQVYHSSKALADRNTGILYYDCTNYFFESEEEDGIRQYGMSKEHRPNPIVQMGLFMDGNGLPLAFSMNPGAMNEQPTLKPLEQRILDDFSVSKLIVCTDAGLGSMENRVFNNRKDRAFIVTQSLKKMKKFLIDWALDPEGWRMAGSQEPCDLRQIDDGGDNPNTYYKSRWIKEDGLEQKLIVSYAPKYKAYQRQVRAGQIERAQRIVANPGKLTEKRGNNPKRFIEQEHCTQDGQLAKHKLIRLDTQSIAREERFDGFYGVCTNLDEEIETIVRINKGRWEIEESFRILKTEFRARPVYLSRENRIRAHFLICFLSLLVFRLMEKKLKEAFPAGQIIQTLRDMLFYQLGADGFLPAYTRTPLTDALHEAFGFRTDWQILSKKNIAQIQTKTQNARTLLNCPHP
jgi:transposase